MIGREYEQYLQSTAAAQQKNCNLRFWLAVTGIGFVLPLIGFLLRG
ncbi:hypothetical protein [Desulforamulus aeronauticus]|uniref:Uncharacterized protein n=1 Tax=Desulforamulus aeronauticus DSM 10349 TaxID=1121421 RepID=A0A1M6WYJ1_9FIRM|nr:hypothetical protein [Desulforamulus aeronauticus]SHK98787.1 hypothetical protein SAMN02745123_03821 [Desulforamulus aeronauticus DSM 10349]